MSIYTMIIGNTYLNYPLTRVVVPKSLMPHIKQSWAGALPCIKWECGVENMPVEDILAYAQGVNASTIDKYWEDSIPRGTQYLRIENYEDLLEGQYNRLIDMIELNLNLKQVIFVGHLDFGLGGFITAEHYLKLCRASKRIGNLIPKAYEHQAPILPISLCHLTAKTLTKAPKVDLLQMPCRLKEKARGGALAKFAVITDDPVIPLTSAYKKLARCLAMDTLWIYSS